MLYEVITRGTLVGYLPQDGLEHAGRTLFEEARSALDHLLAIEKELADLEARISTAHRQEDLDRYALLQEEFLQRGGYAMEAEVARVLKGLGFAEARITSYNVCYTKLLRVGNTDT